MAQPLTSEELTQLFQVIESEPTGKLSKLAKVAELNLAEDYIGVDLSDENLSGDNLSNANLSNANLSNANLCESNLSSAILSDTNLSNADLSNTDLSNANLSNTNLSNADLSNADLSNADLSNADLNNANLSNADLSNANLSNADLNNANLFDANLDNANLSNANLSCAKLRDTSLLRTKNLTTANFGDTISITTNLGLSQEKILSSKQRETIYENATVSAHRVAEVNSPYVYTLNSSKFGSDFTDTQEAQTEDKLSNHDLILRCQAGVRPARAAFAELLRRYQSQVDRVLYHLAADWSDRADLAQEVWIRVYRNINRLQEPSTFRGWLSRIATNIFYEELRKRNRVVSPLSLDAPRSADNGEIDWEIAGDTPGPEEELTTREFYEQLREAIADLPEVFRTTIVLREIEGLAYKEIAEITGVSLGTVKSRIARAKARLQTQLQNYLD